jgi:hypothetical protein
MRDTLTALSRCHAQGDADVAGQTRGVASRSVVRRWNAQCGALGERGLQAAWSGPCWPAHGLRTMTITMLGREQTL